MLGCSLIMSALILALVGHMRKLLRKPIQQLVRITHGTSLRVLRHRILLRIHGNITGIIYNFSQQRL